MISEQRLSESEQTLQKWFRGTSAEMKDDGNAPRPR